MRLTINGETVDYTLEQEKTLGDVVGGVRRWLAAEGFLITGLRDGQSDLLPLPVDSWTGRDIAGVERLEILAAHTGDMRIEHWKTVRSWLGALLDELAGTGTGSLPELLDDLPGTLEGLAANPFLPPGSDAAERFAAAWTGQEPAAVRAWPPERVAAAVAVTRELADAVEQRLSEATRPSEALDGYRARLTETMTRLTEVSLLLQTGRDREAMEIVVGFTDTVQSLMGLLPFLGPDRERARLFAELTPPLRDLIAAFTNRDSVLIGDLLEYEVAPRLERLLPTLSRTA
jgi:hypothetical protein